MRGAASVVSLLALVAVACGSEGVGRSGPPEEVLVVAAASDLRPAFEELGERFTAATGTPVAFDFGSSGQLTQRLLEGAPVDVFASADDAYVDQVLDAGIGDAATRRTYAFGRLVIWSTAERSAGWADLGDLAADDDLVAVAIANPEHAPYGAAAQEALATAGALERLEERLILGENVSDTQRLVETGNADVGVIALSLALAADERDAGRWVLVDDALHRPLRQDLLVTTDVPERRDRARAFVELVDGEDGRDVMRRYGFLLPGDEPGDTPGDGPSDAPPAEPTGVEEAG